jgi:hypothetical protein
MGRCHACGGLLDGGLGSCPSCRARIHQFGAKRKPISHLRVFVLLAVILLLMAVVVVAFAVAR